MIELQWVYEALGALVKEPTEENRKVVAEIICQELNDRRKETMRNVEKYIYQVAHDILCASSKSGSDVEQVMPKGIIVPFASFDESYQSAELEKVVDWLMAESN